MLFGTKPLNEITEADLQNLVDAQIGESKTLDYKTDLLGIHRNNKQDEFRKDIVSFANADGGYLIYGISEKGNNSGTPNKLCGEPIENQGKEITNLEQILDDVQPRFPRGSIKMQMVELVSITSKTSSAKPLVALVVYVPKSWSGPHMIKGGQFYWRGDTKNQMMDFTQVRTAFDMSSGLSDRLQNFRMERIGRIHSGNTPIPVADVPKLVLHVMPMSAFDRSLQIDIRNRTIAARIASELPLAIEDNVYDTKHRYNFEGCVGWFENGQLTTSYIQAFHNGTIEAVDTSSFYLDQNEKIVSIPLMEKRLIEGLPPILKFQQDLGITPPLLIMISLVGVKDYRSRDGSVTQRGSTSYYPFDRDVYLLPELMLYDYEIDVPNVLHPTFDMIENALGGEACFHYDFEGKWQFGKRFYR